MSTLDLRFRQIHLDFHTSPDILGVGADFDPEEFVMTLEKAHVNSITCFARCHHGLIYYDTKLNPERRHPHLTRDLLKDQIAACHARNIRVPIYTTVQWDHFTANEHPEWLILDENGYPIGTRTFEAGFYRQICLNSPYRDFLKAHTREILETLPVDGFFFDIVQPRECACRYCRSLMEAEGLDPTNAEARRGFALQTINRFKTDMSGFVRELNPEAGIYYNAGHIGTRHREVAHAYSHFELETLPSGGWGYLHFPVSMRYTRNLGNDCLAQTGKFHTSWGDFHSFKNLPALQYECFRMLALGAKCMIGDQLHPSGRIDPYVYDLVGQVYREIEQKEPWCHGAKAVTEVGVFTPEEFLGGDARNLPVAITGAERMLDEAAIQFDILDSASNLSPYKVLILPDNIPVSSAFAAKLESYLAKGGALIATFESGLNPEKTGFALPALGVRLASDGPRDLDGRLVRGRHFPRGDYAEYLLPTGAIGEGLPPTEHVMYIRGLDIAAAHGTTVLANLVQPYFDRTYQHFCSHRQTPSSGRVGGPGIVQNGRAIYFSHPIFSQYHQNAPRWCKTLLLNALKLLLPEPLLRHSGPSTLFAALNEQAAEHRWILHALHCIPERRGLDFDVIEDVIPLHEVKFSIKTDRPVRSVVAVPQNQSLSFHLANGRVEFILPRLEGHQMVALSFGATD